MDGRSFSSCKSAQYSCGPCDDMRQCRVARGGYTERRMAHVTHAERGTQSAHIAPMGYTRCGVAERLFDVCRHRPVAACMVKDAPRKGGVSAWCAQGEWSDPGRRPACRGRSLLLLWRAAGGRRASVRNAADGVVNSGRARGSGPSRGGCSQGLSELRVTAVSNNSYTQSNIFEFVTT